MEKINLGSIIINYPMPVGIIGSHVHDKPNFLTVAWISMVSYKPPKIAIILGNHHFTNKGIKENHSFSINFPSINLLEKTDYCGLVSGESIEKGNLFNIFYSELNNAPMIMECPICVECKLDKIVENGLNEMFIGDIIGVYTEEKFISNNKIDFQKIKPLILSQNNSEYWILGNKIAQAWNIGKNLIK